jgi:signal transduction histidine kinase
MKLITRLVIVVTAVLAIISVISSTQSILVNRNEKLATYKSVLSNLTTQLSTTTEDEVSLALFVAENSPIPMSLVFVTNNSSMSYLSEDAGSNMTLPDQKSFQKGLRQPIERDGYLTKYFAINDEEYLAYYLSTSTVNEELGRTYRPIITFNVLLILMGALLVAFLFRRDSKLNAEAKAIQEFIGDASHELKTPLTIIRGYSELLAQDPASADKYATRINRESLRMSMLIDKLLKLSELDENTQTKSIEIDLVDYLQSQIEDLLVIQPMRDVKLLSQPLTINAPIEVLDTLLSNLITNARVHTPEQAPIQISIFGRKVIIEDGGPGLEVIPDKPFKRFDKSRSRESGGAGLGMSLIQKSAKKLGAKLDFGKSALGGLKVEITF